MKSSQLNKVLGLVKRTGDRCVIVDNESESVMVLLDLPQYEKLLHFTTPVEKMSEEELLDRINRDIALWQARNKSEAVEDEEDDFEDNQDDKDALSLLEDTGIPWPTYGSAPHKSVKSSDFGEEWPNLQEESLEDVAEEESDEEEEKFYLEPVE
ncbi:MAG: hypothetical protein UX39_C0001G0079 [Candidatus Magasanikbacteria bacterium GW2011_GWA2_46_17]|uniref:Uncharacterized protein n=1 Tax=Candidatus Magasanikbacteria bacterium GW2011_GWA2_46_17 TaxID=1619042 RepID=A0A0G1P387_9BACT|nr:MAG: hypothetical protein UX39_C0001G0079 [Candidatus Magasanikbacteria bacterium GW2011_GWA2_46_17]